MNKSELKGLVILFLFLMLCGSSSLIIYDSGKVFKTFVENEKLAYIYASLIVASIALIIILKGLPRYTQLSAYILVFVLEGVMLWTSAIGFSSPLFDHKLTQKNESLLTSYRAQYASNEKSIRGLEKVAADFGRKNPINLARTQKEISKIQAINAKLQTKIESVLQSSGENETGIAKQKQGNAVIFRLGCGLIQLVLLSILRAICPIDIRKFQNLQNAKPKNNDNDNEKQNVPHGTIAPQNISDKEYVQKYVDAECTGKRGGIFTVTDSEGNVLGQARNSRPAWANARRNLERKVA